MKVESTDYLKLKLIESPLSGYMEDAYPISIALCKKQNLDWLYTNFIQLVYLDPNKYSNQALKFYKPSFRTGQIWDTFCPVLCCDDLNSSTIDDLNINIIDLVCKSLQRGFYVKIYLDEYYVPYRFLYKKEHYIHETLFNGFDKKNKKLFGISYVTDSSGYTFKEFELGFEDFLDSYKLADRIGVQANRITLLSFNPEKNFEFDLKGVKQSIYEYIHSENSDLRYFEVSNPKKDYVFGLGIYDKLIDYYKDFKRQFSIIQLHNLYEHKKLMYERIKFMIENQYISENTDLLNLTKLLIENSLYCKTQGLKYFVTQREKDYKKLCDLLKQIKQQDEELMNDLYKEICLAEIKETEDSMIVSSSIHWRDAAIKLEKTYKEFVEISFSIEFLNNKSKGYVGFTNELNVNEYTTPFYFIVDQERKGFFIGFKNTKHEIVDGVLSEPIVDDVIPNISCEYGRKYYVDVLINTTEKTFRVNVSDLKNESTYESPYIEKVSYINQITVIHENSYRFAVKDFKIKDNTLEWETINKKKYDKI